MTYGEPLRADKLAEAVARRLQAITGSRISRTADRNLRIDVKLYTDSHIGLVKANPAPGPTIMYNPKLNVSANPRHQNSRQPLRLLRLPPPLSLLLLRPPPLNPIPHTRNRPRTTPNEEKRQNRISPPIPHRIAHRNNRRRGRSPDQTPQYIVRRRRRRGRAGVDIDDQDIQHLGGADLAVAEDEEEDDGAGEGDGLGEHPAVADYGGGRGDEEGEGDLDAG